MLTHALKRCDLGAGRAVGHANRILANHAVQQARVGIEGGLVGSRSEDGLEGAPGDKAARSDRASRVDARSLELWPRRRPLGPRAGHGEFGLGDFQAQRERPRTKSAGTRRSRLDGLRRCQVGLWSPEEAWKSIR